jgi:hypothetical protein
VSPAETPPLGTLSVEPTCADAALTGAAVPEVRVRFVQLMPGLAMRFSRFAMSTMAYQVAVVLGAGVVPQVRQPIVGRAPNAVADDKVCGARSDERGHDESVNQMRMTDAQLGEFDRQVASAVVGAALQDPTRPVLNA